VIVARVLAFGLASAARALGGSAIGSAARGMALGDAAGDSGGLREPSPEVGDAGSGATLTARALVEAVLASDVALAMPVTAMIAAMTPPVRDATVQASISRSPRRLDLLGGTLGTRPASVVNPWGPASGACESICRAVGVLAARRALTETNGIGWIVALSSGTG
jgi:hypothetical protein